MTFPIGLAASVFYLMTIAIIGATQYLKIKKTANGIESPGAGRGCLFIPWFIATLLHSALLFLPLLQSKDIHLNLFSLASMSMLLASIILFFSTLRRKLELLTILILPFVLLSIILLLFSPANEGKTIQLNSGIGAHAIFSLSAYAMLMLASFQALVLFFQNKNLNKLNKSTLFRLLPSLEDMEYFLFRLIFMGVILLTLSLASGFYFLESFFGSKLGHKTVLSVFAWCVFSVLLFGRKKYGWRGKTAIKWTLIGFAFLMAAFFGSLVIREYIINI